MREEILAEIRRVAAENEGKPPGKRAFEKETGISEAQWSGKIWARWSDALSDAGFTPNTMNFRSDPAHLLVQFAQAVRFFNKVPTAPEMKLYRAKNSDFPDVKTLMSFFGNKDGLIEAFKKYINDHEDHRDLQKFIVERQVAQTHTVYNTSEGWVYMLKSGAFYKIGRSDQILKRLKQITIALPENVVMIHAIKTDDPSGIEGYWHKRFAEKRANGEWFKLTKADVAAFKKRKFM